MLGRRGGGLHTATCSRGIAGHCALLPPFLLLPSLFLFLLNTPPTSLPSVTNTHSQLRALKPVLEQTNHPSLPLLNKILEEFRDDELEHLDTAVEEGALKAPGHALLSAAIGAACRVGIAVASKV